MNELDYQDDATSIDDDYREFPTMEKLQLRYAKLSLCMYLHDQILQAYHTDILNWRTIVMGSIVPYDGKRGKIPNNQIQHIRRRASSLDTGNPTMNLEAATFLQQAQMRLLQEVSELGY